MQNKCAIKLFAHSYVYAPDIPTKIYADDDFVLREMNMLLEDSAPEGYIINDLALCEIQRIARAAHMQKSFTLLQPSFFGVSTELHKHPIPTNILTAPNYFQTPNPQTGHIGSSFSIPSTSSGSYSTSALASNASLDSNISASSLPANTSNRYLICILKKSCFNDIRSCHSNDHCIFIVFKNLDL